MPKARILVIEDDRAIRRGLVDALAFAGYATFEADNGDDGLELALQTACDLILLDLVLPGGKRGHSYFPAQAGPERAAQKTGMSPLAGPDGFEILRQVRATRPTLPVLILTALGQEDDRVKGLRLGADDYVVKPFSVKELLARVEAVLRRSPERPSDVASVKVSGATIDLARCEVRFKDGARTELSERERELVRYLATNAGRAISRDELLARVWGLDPAGLYTRTVDMHIARLREKLRDGPEDPRILLTVRGKGYMFAAAPADPAGREAKKT